MDVKLCFCSWVLLSGIVLCQQPGTEFAVVFMQNFLPSLGKPHLELVLTAFFPDTEVYVELPNTNYNKTVSLTPRRPGTVLFSKKAELLHSSRSNMTVHVTSNKPISVVATNKRPYTTSVTVVSPVMDWGVEYYIMTPDYGPDGTFGQMAIVNGPKPNHVLILLKGFIEFESTAYLSGQHLGLMLGPWESVQLQTNETLSGSHVLSGEPIAVFAGHSCAEISGKCNHICVQLPPVNVWGSNFAAPMLSYVNLTKKIYVFASTQTTVDIMSENSLSNVTVIPGELVVLESSSKFLLLSSSGRIMVLLYAGGGIYNSINFDGFLFNLPPLEKACVTYSIVSVPGFSNLVVLVDFADDRDWLKLNHQPLPQVEWDRIEGTDLVSAILPLDKRNGYYSISNIGHDFGLATIGMAKMNSYAVSGICLDRVYRICGFECTNASFCQVLENKPCVTYEPKTCMAWGRTHFRTIYGIHKFRSGICSNILMASQGDDSGLLPFSVEILPNIDFTVRIKVFGLTLELNTYYTGGVLVNGEQKYIPIFLQNGRLNITRYVLSTIINASFGLRLIIGDHGFLHIKIPGTYYEVLSGICVEQSPNRLLNLTVNLFGQSETENTCISHDIHSNSCENKNSVAVVPPCRLMMEAGPFQACHSLLDPKPFVESCEFEICNRGEYCSVLEAFALACGIEGVDMMGWRNVSDCELQCSYYSHYESCPACPLTCLDTQTSNCSADFCYEGCVCDDGFTLSRDNCVPTEEECGCMLNGSYYPAGLEFLGSDCRTQCSCSRSKVECNQIHGCYPGSKCELMSGQWSCRNLPYLSCKVYGETHYVPFDDNAYTIEGYCESKVIGLCSPDQAMKNFEVRLIKEQEEGVVYTRAINITIYGRTIILAQTYRAVQVDGIFVQTPYIVDHKLQIFRSGLDAVILQSEMGLVVTFNSMRNVVIRVPVSLLGAVCGLCVSSPSPMPSDPSCDYCQGNCSSCSVDEYSYYGSENMCGIVKDFLGPFRECHHKVNYEPYFQACLDDLCNHNWKWMVCKMLSSYTAACQEANAIVYPWRTEQFCDYQCPSDSHYTLCGPSCPSTCHGTLPFSCDLPCREGCLCNPGYILSGYHCVLPKECGCYADGQYWNQDDIFYDDQCQNLCLCMREDVVCKASACHPSEKCLVVQGRRGCYAQNLSSCWVSTINDYSFHSHTNTNEDCFYVMAQVCASTNLTDFVILLKPHIGRNQTEFENVVFKVYGHTMVLSWKAETIQVDGENKNFPVNVDDKVMVYKNVSINLVTDFGLLLNLDSFIFLNIQNRSYDGNVCGFCGSAYRNISDGFRNLSPVDIYSFPANEPCGDGFERFHNEWDHTDNAKYCDIILQSKGPFRDCHALLSTRPFYSDCYSDVDLQSVCRTIQTYANECRKAGGMVYSWESEVVCSNDSISPVYMTVPPSIYTIHPEVTGCLLTPDQQKCLPSPASTCNFQVGKDKVYFDGIQLQLLSEDCSLVLAKLCDSSGAHVFTSVVINLNTQGSRTVPNLDVEIYGERYAMQWNGDQDPWVNNVLVNVSNYLVDSSIHLKHDGSWLILETDFGLVIKWHQDGPLVIQLPSAYQENLCGLCAYQNISINYLEASSDLYRGSYHCFNRSTEKAGCNGNENGTVNDCSLLLGEESPFKRCHNAISPDVYYEMCQSHLCEFNADHPKICEDLQEYAVWCQSKGISIEPWRNESFCPFKCPPEATYELCTIQCSNCMAESCAGVCTEGCKCTEGRLWEGQSCVSNEICNQFGNQEDNTVPIQPNFLHCGSSVESQPTCLVCAVSNGSITTYAGFTSLVRNGAYDLLRPCDYLTPQWLRIVLSLQTPLTSKLYVFFEGIYIMVFSSLKVLVNGKIVALPLTVATDMYLSRSTGVVTIGILDQMEISLGSTGVLTIKVSELVHEHCGACVGNSVEVWRAEDFSDL